MQLLENPPPRYFNEQSYEYNQASRESQYIYEISQLNSLISVKMHFPHFFLKINNERTCKIV